MPMDFPDMHSLVDVASIHKFRAPSEGETEADYRKMVADHVSKIDFIESEEIRNGVGWDKFSRFQNLAMLSRGASLHK